MKIMIFGGSFDPPHNGHQYVARTIIENNICDQVWYVPCFRHPFDKNITESKHRLAMLQLIHTDTILVERYEIEQENVSYSIDTLLYLQNKFPENEFSWLIGSDQVGSFHLWRDYSDLLKSWKVYVYPRGDYPLEPLLPNMLALSHVHKVDGMSTHVRQCIRAGKGITELVDPRVEKYIIEHNLYK